MSLIELNCKCGRHLNHPAPCNSTVAELEAALAVYVATCSRCKTLIKDFAPAQDGVTAGYYVAAAWPQFTNPGELHVCDACAHSDPRYVAIYGPKPPTPNDDRAALLDSGAEALDHIANVQVGQHYPLNVDAAKANRADATAIRDLARLVREYNASITADEPRPERWAADAILAWARGEGTA